MLLNTEISILQKVKRVINIMNLPVT